MFQRAQPKGGATQDPEGATPTAFAPAERASTAEVEASIARLTGHPVLRALLDVADVSVVVLNRQRQILVANSALLRSLPPGTVELAGLRAGEALGCVHAWQGPGGCGTSRECSQCGAVLAILESQRGQAMVERECLMTVERDDHTEALELRVRASPLEIGGERYTLLGLRDISAEKRRDALERVFLHDVTNTISPLLVWAEVLEERPQEAPAVAVRIAALARRLAGDIEEQRVLMEAERGTLATHRTEVDPQAALEATRAVLDGHPRALGRQLEVTPPRQPLTVTTDESLLVRVLVNMAKNALEATPEGGSVRLAALGLPGACELRVWNAGAIAPEVALSMFKRSFTTKPGPGRGLGTFSIRLFGERYLGGTVGFTSTEAEGTTFFIRLPV